jgi:hypothetical protein
MMESKATRRAIRAFPIDFELTQDPSDQLRKFLDIPGRQTTIAGEYLHNQLDNLFIETADPNEPYYVYNSGRYIPKDADLSGYWVEYIDDLTSMEVTGFSLDETIYPSGLTSSTILGVSFADDPISSGYLYLTCEGDRNIYRYIWKELYTSPDIEKTVEEEQSYDANGEDEYLILDRSSVPGSVVAELRHEPVGDVTIIDAKNLASPWNPEDSEGIIASQSEITVSGKYVILTSPRPSYSPATKDVLGNTTYPTDYQPDQYWQSSFIAEYDYYSQEAPYGICQPTNRHELGLVGAPIVAAKDLE